MTIVGEVSLDVLPNGKDFPAQLLKIATSAAGPAGREAGKTFSAEFLGELKAGGFVSLFDGLDVEAATAGIASGKAFSSAFDEARSAGTVPSVFGSPADLILQAEAEGATVGRRFSQGITAGIDEGSTLTGAITRGAPAAEAAAEVEGAATGRRFSAGMTTGADEGNALSTILTRSSNVVRDVAGKEGGAAGKLFGSAFGTAAVPLTAAVVLGASVKLAGDFEQQTNILVTAAGEQQKNLANVRNGILDIATSTGTAWKDVTDAAYTAEKAGLRNNDVLTVVKAAAQGAKEEGASLSTVTTGLTTALTDYKLPASDAVKITDELKTGAGQAKATFESFTGSLGAVLPRASAVGVGLSDVLGVLDSVTQAGVPVQQASQNIAQTLKNLSAPIGTQVSEFGQLGISVTDVTTRLGDKSPSNPDGRGLAGTLDYLSQTVLQKLGPSGTLLLNTFNQSKLAAADATTEFNNLGPAAQTLAKGYEDGTVSAKDYRTASRNLGGEQSNLAQQFLATYNQAHGFQQAIKDGGPAAQSYLNAMNKLTGGQQGVTVALAASAGQAGITQTRIDAISKSAKDAGSSVTGWSTTQHNLNTQFAEFKQEIERTGIELGQTFLPPLKDILGVLTAHPAVLKLAAEGVVLLGAAWATVKIGSLIGDLGTLAGKILGVGAASTTAAAETRAAGLGSALTGAEAAGAAGVGAEAEGAEAGAVARAGAGATIAGAATKLVIPVAITYAASSALGLNKGLEDIFKGDIDKVQLDAPNWIKKSVNGILGLFGDTISAEAKLTKNEVGPYNEVLAKYGHDAGHAFATAIESEKGNAAAAWNDVFGGIKDADPTLFGNKGAAAAKAFWDATTAPAAVQEFQDSLKNANLLLDSNTNSLKGNTAGAASNRAGLASLGQQAVSAATAFSKSTGVQTDFTSSLKLAIPQILNQAQATGIGRQAAADFLNTVIKIPGEKITTVGLVGDGSAEKSVLTYLASLNDIPAVKTTVLQIVSDFSGNNPAGAASFGADFAAIGGADGGPVVGPGPKGKDSVLRYLAPGEHIVTAPEVDAAGGHTAMLQIRQALLHGGMASGGAVTGGTVTTSAQTAVVDYLKALAKQATQIAKYGVSMAQKTTTTDVKAGQAAITTAIKEGNGPLQTYIGDLLKAAQGNLYTTSLSAVQDGHVSPAENGAGDSFSETGYGPDGGAGQAEHGQHQPA